MNFTYLHVRSVCHKPDVAMTKTVKAESKRSLEYRSIVNLWESHIKGKSDFRGIMPLIQPELVMTPHSNKPTTSRPSTMAYFIANASKNVIILMYFKQNLHVWHSNVNWTQRGQCRSGFTNGL